MLAANQLEVVPQTFRRSLLRGGCVRPNHHRRDGASFDVASAVEGLVVDLDLFALIIDGLSPAPPPTLPRRPPCS